MMLGGATIYCYTIYISCLGTVFLQWSRSAHSLLHHCASSVISFSDLYKKKHLEYSKNLTAIVLCESIVVDEKLRSIYIYLKKNMF